NKSSGISLRQSQQLAFSFSRSELRSVACNAEQRCDLFALLRNQQLRVADNVDEQDMPDLKLHFRGGVGGHVTPSPTSPDKVSRNADRRGDCPNRDRCAEAPVLAPDLHRKSSANVAARRSLFPSRRNEPRCGRACLHNWGPEERPWMWATRQSPVGYV